VKKRISAFITGGIFLAVLMVPALVSAQRAGESPDQRTRPRARMMVRDSLDITSEQETKIEAFRKARAEESRVFRERMAKLREERRELTKDSKTNEARIGDLIDKTYQLRAEQAKTALKTRGEWEKIFTPEQLEKMRKSREAFAGRAMGVRLARYGRVQPRMGRMMRPGARGFARVGSRGRFGMRLRTPLRWRRR